MMPLTDDQVRMLRLRAQRLAAQHLHTKTPVAHLVSELGGIQAQDTQAARLALRVRSVGLVAADIEYARVQERSIVRTWGPRGTLHLLATEDITWLLPLLGPVFIAGNRRRSAELGLDEDTCARGIQIIRNVLASQGPLTRDELIEHIAVHGLQLVGQARPHLLARAAMEGVICFEPDRDGEPTCVLLSDRIEMVWNAPSNTANRWLRAGNVANQAAEGPPGGADRAIRATRVRNICGSRDRGQRPCPFSGGGSVATC